MKAFVIHGKHDVSFIEKEAPTIQTPTDVLVKVKSAGICGTDLHIYAGEHDMCMNQDRIPGHEFSGEVIAVGSAVTEFAVGDRVVHEPISYCGSCYPCRKGQNNVCTSLKVTGCNCDGGWQELYCADQGQWHKIPDGMTWEQAALVEPYTIAAQVCSQGAVQPGDVVLIHGGGPVGLMCCDTAKQLGATVIVSEIMAGRLALAKEAGADYAINPMEINVEELGAEITGGEGVNVILDCAGLGRLMEQNIRMLSPAGRFVPVAPCPIHIENGILVMAKQLTLIGSRLQMGQFKPVIENFVNYEKTATKMITHTFDFNKSDEAFAFADGKHPETGKVVVTFQ